MGICTFIIHFHIAYLILKYASHVVYHISYVRTYTCSYISCRRIACHTYTEQIQHNYIMIHLSYKFSRQFIKYDIYKVATCYHGSCVNDLSPETSEVPGIGHGQSTSANGDGLCVAKITAKPTVFVDFEAPFGGVVFSISTKKLDSSPVLLVLLFQSFHPLYSPQDSACPPPLSPALLPSTEAAASH